MSTWSWPRSMLQRRSTGGNALPVTSPSDLLDKDAIAAVLVRYCHLLDTRGFTSLAGEVFSEGAVFAHEGAGWQGGGEIAARIEVAMRPFEGTAHVLGNVVID